MKLFLFWERAFFISSLLRVEKEADEGGTLHAMANKSFVITSILVKDHPIIIIITITSILAKDQSITMTYTMHRTRHIRCWWSRRRSFQATPGAQSNPAYNFKILSILIFDPLMQNPPPSRPPQKNFSSQRLMTTCRCGCHRINTESGSESSTRKNFF